MAYSFKIIYKNGHIYESCGIYNELPELDLLTKSSLANGDVKEVQVFKDGVQIEVMEKEDKEEEKKMKTKEMPIVEVSKNLKAKLDYLDTVEETNDYYNSLSVNNKFFEELIDIQKELEMEYVTQALMYLVSTRNYEEKIEPQHHVLYGLINTKYYVWSNKPIPFNANVFIKTFDNKEEAEKHADELNEFVKGE